MRHKVHGRRLNRDSAHRKSLRKNLMADLIAHEQIVTTEAKARMLRPTVEKLITLAKKGVAEGGIKEVNARRLATARIAGLRVTEDDDGLLEYVDVVKKLFNDVAPRYTDRPGGYTRIVKMGRRPGDNAKIAAIMLVEGESSSDE